MSVWVYRRCRVLPDTIYTTLFAWVCLYFHPKLGCCVFNGSMCRCLASFRNRPSPADVLKCKQFKATEIVHCVAQKWLYYYTLQLVYKDLYNMQCNVHICRRICKQQIPRHHQSPWKDIYIKTSKAKRIAPR